LNTPLGQELSRLGIQFSREIEAKLEIYVEELERWNRRMNLTALAGRELRRRLLAEPCWIGQQLQMSGTILDLGSGNGSPGIPLYIGCNLRRADLVEARMRRAAFLRHVAGRLDAKSIVVHRLRLEDLTTPLRPDWITLQGVKPIASLIETMQRLFPSTTRVVWITSGDVPLPAGSRIIVPYSNTVVRVLQLDQF
jgi:16S rRNA (guanine(527)-N(7))-methyltransferase RsmG